jgi:hypothetical protein
MDNTPITGASGATYAPLNTTPQAVDIRQAMSLIQEGLSQLTTLITSLSARVGENPPQNPDLQETLKLVLQQSDWAMPMLKESLDMVDDIVEDAVRDRMGEEVSSWFNNEFSLADYVDIDDLVKEVIETKLSRATITVDL